MVIGSYMLAVALVARPAPLPAAILLLALVQPVWCLAVVVGVGAASWSGRSDADLWEGAYLHAVAMELAAGASLRTALGAAADRAPELELGLVIRLAEAGAPLARLADALASALPQQGRVAGAALRTAGATGGRVATVFENLAQVSAEDRQLRRETRAATAQARISAWIVGGLPACYLGYQFFTGRVAELVQSPVGLGIVAVGGGFLVTGSSVVTVMVRRALT